MNRFSRRAVLLVAVVALLAGLAAPAGAARNPVVGNWVAIDADNSFWQVTISNSGRLTGIDSGTISCEGFRTRTWGQLETVGENTFTLSLNLRCLAGPQKRATFTITGIPVTYQPATDTLLQENVDPFRDVVFCHRPCDPADFAP